MWAKCGLGPLVLHGAPLVQEALAQSARGRKGFGAHQVKQVGKLKRGAVDGQMKDGVLWVAASHALGHALAAGAGHGPVAGVAGRRGALDAIVVTAWTLVLPVAWLGQRS